MSDTVSLESTEGVTLIRIDDGKANALAPEVFSALKASLDTAEQSGDAVVLAGRPGKFSAGFDLGVMRSGASAGRALVAEGARFALRLARFPAPVVIACTGHALAMGSVLLLAVDTRIGARGDFKIGFNEVAIGMATPLFLVEFARERLSKRHLLRATVEAEIYTPDNAVDAGFLDQVQEPDQVVQAARAEAARLGKLPRQAFVETRSRLRGASLEQIEATLESDMAAMFGGA